MLRILVFVSWVLFCWACLLRVDLSCCVALGLVLAV